MKKYIDVEEDIDNQIPAHTAKKKVEISRICTRSSVIYNCLEHFEVKKRGRNVYTNHEICVIWRVLSTKSCIK